MNRRGDKQIGEMTHSDLTQFIGNILATQSPEKSTSMQQVDVHSVLNVKDKMNLSPQAKKNLLGAYLLSADAAATYETITHAASTYETAAHAAATYETLAHASATYAPLASPTFTGVPLSTTPATADNTTKIATTAYVKAQGYLTAALTSFNGRATAAAVPTTGDYTAAMVTNAADKSSASEQIFSATVGGNNFIAEANPAQVSVASAGTFTPNGNFQVNSVNLTSGTALTIANFSGFAGGTPRSSLIAISLQNGTAGSITVAITWGTAYRFGGWQSTGIVIPASSEWTWLFLADMNFSRFLCVGSTNGTWA